MSGRIKTREPEDRASLPIIGKVSCGAKSEKGFPMSLGHFVANGKYASHFVEAFGSTPTTIQVIFIESEPSKVCNERFELRDDSGRLLASGDGLDFKVWSGKKYVIREAKEGQDLMGEIYDHFKPKKGWDAILTLKFLIPKINTVVGLWKFSTKGEASSIPNIREAFDTVARFRNGSVVGVVFDLNVEKVKTQKPGDKSSFPVVTLVANNSEENIEHLNISHLIQTPNLLGDGTTEEAAD